MCLCWTAADWWTLSPGRGLSFYLSEDLHENMMHSQAPDTNPNLNMVQIWPNRILVSVYFSFKSKQSLCPPSCKLSQKIKISRRGHPNPSLPSEIRSFISISILSKRNIPRCLAPAKEKQAHTYRPHYSFIRGNSDQTQVYGAHRDSSVTTSSVNRIQHLEILSPSPWKSLLKPRILQIFPFSPVCVWDRY